MRFVYSLLAAIACVAQASGAITSTWQTAPWTGTPGAVIKLQDFPNQGGPAVTIADDGTPVTTSDWSWHAPGTQNVLFTIDYTSAGITITVTDGQRPLTLQYGGIEYNPVSGLSLRVSSKGLDTVRISGLQVFQAAGNGWLELPYTDRLSHSLSASWGNTNSARILFSDPLSSGLRIKGTLSYSYFLWASQTSAFEIGYNSPEPATFAVAGGALLLLMVLGRRTSARRALR